MHSKMSWHQTITKISVKLLPIEYQEPRLIKFLLPICQSGVFKTYVFSNYSNFHGDHWVNFNRYSEITGMPGAYSTLIIDRIVISDTELFKMI